MILFLFGIMFLVIFTWPRDVIGRLELEPVVDADAVPVRIRTPRHATLERSPDPLIISADDIVAVVRTSATSPEIKPCVNTKETRKNPCDVIPGGSEKPTPVSIACSRNRNSTATVLRHASSGTCEKQCLYFHTSRGIHLHCTVGKCN